MTDEGIRVRVLFFAKARELTKLDEGELLVTASKVPAQILKDEVLHAFPLLQPIATTVVLAVNQQYVESEDLELKSGDEIAVIPPLSGG